MDIDTVGVAIASTAVEEAATLRSLMRKHKLWANLQDDVSMLALHSGLRNQEMRLLRWNQIDLLEGTLAVGKSKTTGGEAESFL